METDTHAAMEKRIVEVIRNMNAEGIRPAEWLTLRAS